MSQVCFSLYLEDMRQQGHSGSGWGRAPLTAQTGQFCQLVPRPRMEPRSGQNPTSLAFKGAGPDQGQYSPYNEKWSCQKERRTGIHPWPPCGKSAGKVELLLTEE